MVGRALGNEVGTNVFDLLATDTDGNVQYYATTAAISEAIAEEDEFACVQYHHTMGVTARKDGDTLGSDIFFLRRWRKRKGWHPGKARRMVDTARQSTGRWITNRRRQDARFERVMATW